jgi:hypothetical protein
MRVKRIAHHLHANRTALMCTRGLDDMLAAFAALLEVLLLGDTRFIEMHLARGE